MVLRGTAGRFLAVVAIAGGAGFAAGCQNKDALNGAAAPPKEKITQSELLAFCPPIGLRQGTAFHTSYENAVPARPARSPAPAADGGTPTEEAAFTDKPDRRVVFQTSITDVTRSCTRANGVLTMKVGVAGKVVPGPAAKSGTVQLPIRIAITNGDSVVFSQLYRYSVQVGSLSGATQFLFTTQDVSFPDPATRGVRGFAGFDEGPSAAGEGGTPDLPPG